MTRVKAKMRGEAERFGMSMWWTDQRGHEATLDEFLWLEARGACGTAACIAGWAIVLAGRRSAGAEPAGTAGRLLGVSLEDAEALFLPYNWPNGEYFRYADAPTAQARVEVAIEMIEAWEGRMIAKYGADRAQVEKLEPVETPRGKVQPANVSEAHKERELCPV